MGLIQRDVYRDSWDNNNDFYGRKASIIKWGIFLGIIALIVGFVVLSYVHAGRRLKKGLEPLPYHRWTVTRRRRRQLGNGAPVAYVVYPNGADGSYYMHNQPPPQYVPGNGPPPMYPGPPPAKEGEANVNINEGPAGAQQIGTTGEPPAYIAPPAPAAGSNFQQYR